MFKFLFPLEQFSNFTNHSIITGLFDFSITNQIIILLLLLVVLVALFVIITKICKFENFIILLMFKKALVKKFMFKLKEPFKKFLISFRHLYNQEFVSILLFFYFNFFYFLDLFLFLYYYFQLMKIRSIMQCYGTSKFMWIGYEYIFTSSYSRAKSKKLLLQTEYVSKVNMEEILYHELTYLNLHFLEKFAYSLYIWKVILVSMFKLLLFLLLGFLFI